MFAPDHTHECRGDDTSHIDKDTVEREPADSLTPGGRGGDQRGSRSHEGLRDKDVKRSNSYRPPPERVICERESGKNNDIDEGASQQDGELTDSIGEMPANKRPAHTRDTYDEQGENDGLGIKLDFVEEDGGEKSEETGCAVNERGE